VVLSFQENIEAAIIVQIGEKPVFDLARNVNRQTNPPLHDKLTFNNWQCEFPQRKHMPAA
jgi:hypothetical protein